MFKALFIRALLCWTRNRIEKWENSRSRCKYFSQIDYCDGRIDSYKDIERILEIIINEHS